MSYFYLLSGTVPEQELALAEGLALIGTATRQDGQVILASDFHEIARSAYARLAAEYWLSTPTVEELLQLVPGLDLEVEEFAIEVHRRPRHGVQQFDSQALCAELARLVKGYPNLDNPKTRLGVVVTPSQVYFGKIVDYCDYGFRKQDEKPCMYSGALPGQMARAVVNLVALPGQRVHDFCCGSGTLVIEALELGAKATGSDISWKNARSASENVEWYGYSPELISTANAFELELTADVVLGNLPYGRALEVSEEELRQFARAAMRIAPRALLVTAQPLAPLLAGEPMRIRTLARVACSGFYRHFELLERPSSTDES